MRMRRKPWARPELDASDFFVKEPTKCKGHWNELFEKKAPLHLEIGCGKGNFINKIALDNPDINFIAMDLKSDVLGVARRIITQSFEDENRKVDNIMLTAWNADRISDIFDKEDKISRIYLNFSNPWPKDRHKKRRLTHPTKLNQYKDFVTDDCELYFKTDNDELFEESLDYLNECGLEVTYKTYDLHASGYEPNYTTEHEEMYTKEGIKIKFLIAKFK